MTETIPTKKPRVGAPGRRASAFSLVAAQPSEDEGGNSIEAILFRNTGESLE